MSPAKARIVARAPSAVFADDPPLFEPQPAVISAPATRMTVARDSRLNDDPESGTPIQASSRTRRLSLVLLRRLWWRRPHARGRIGLGLSGLVEVRNFAGGQVEDSAGLS